MSIRREHIVLGGLFALFILLGGWAYSRVQDSVRQADTNSTNGTNTSSNTPEFSQKVLARGLSNVWDVGFISDDIALFTQRAGTISRLQDGQVQTIHTLDNVFVRGEAGLLGLAVDPDFQSNRYIYACYSTLSDIRISRWRVNQNVTGLEDQQDIVTGLPVNTTSFPGRHSGCRPRFGTDSNLWIGTGDVAIGTNPQDPKSLGGKILRVDRNGKAVAGNLEAPFDTRIFSYGHRNIQGLIMEVKGGVTCRPGYLGFSVEHGPGKDDEVNFIVRGNAGWDPVPGYNEAVAMTDTKKFPDARQALWESGDSTIAPSGGTMVKSEKWGKLNNALLLAVLKDKHVRALILDENCGQKVVEELELFKDEFGRIRSVVMGPDDSLYLTTDNGRGFDSIVKITPK